MLKKTIYGKSFIPISSQVIDMKMSHGPRARSRKKLRKRVRERGLPPIRRYLAHFEIGERAAVDIDPSVHEGFPHHRFQGRTGVIVGKQGRCYKLMIRDGGLKKILIVHPVHLKRVQ